MSTYSLKVMGNKFLQIGLGINKRKAINKDRIFMAEI